MTKFFLQDVDHHHVHSFPIAAPKNTPTGEKLPNHVAALGRGQCCDLCLSAPQISRVHAVIEESPMGYILVDKSRNGTLVNDRLIKRHHLQPNDLIEIGTTRLKFILRRPEHPAFTQGRTASSAQIGMAGKSFAMQRTLDLCRSAARSDLPIVLQGETGTGKTLLARYIHGQSGRRHQIMLSVNCAAISATLMDSELFGHERGAFTGALQRHRGLFLAADGGTLFLDEINEIPVNLQAKLLKALEEKCIRPLGSIRDIPTNVRIIAATNACLEDEMAQGRFRPDLFHRLNIFPILLPSLRERPEDLEALVKHILATAGLQVDLEADALDQLKIYGWPGNIRELRNVIIRAALLCKKSIIRAMDLQFKVPGAEAIRSSLPEPAPEIPPNSSDNAVKSLALHEARVIKEVLTKFLWNRQRTARALEISRSTLLRKMRRYGLMAPAERLIR